MPLLIGGWLVVLGYAVFDYGLLLFEGKPQSFAYLIGASQTKIIYAAAGQSAAAQVEAKLITPPGPNGQPGASTLRTGPAWPGTGTKTG